MKKILITSICSMFLMMSNLAWSACGSISMADMNWPSATLMANVDKIILEEDILTHYNELKKSLKVRRFTQVPDLTYSDSKLVNYKLF